MLKRSIRRGAEGIAILVAALVAGAGLAQPDPSTVRPLRTAPTERFAVSAGVRDWGPATVVGQIILVGGPSGSGGLFAVDMLSGKLQWTFRPTKVNGSVSTPPAVAGNIVIAPFGAANPGAVVGVSLATGKEVWRGPDPAVHAAVATHAGMAYILSKDGNFYALDAATGREVWKVAFTSKRAACASRPIVRDEIIYLTAGTDATAGDASRPASDYLFALDTKTGQERWRYRANVPDAYAAACLQQPVVTADTIFAAGAARIYAVDRSTGRDRWPSVEVRRPIEGRNRLVEVQGLVDAGSVLVGLTSGFLIAFDKASGQIAWDLPGAYSESSPSTAVAGQVLYFQGSPAIRPAAERRGTLHALDLDTRSILWSFSRPTAEANWPFGTVTPVDGGLWVDSYQALVKLQ
jgi:outer membrane protein assembly factor BamB